MCNPHRASICGDAIHSLNLRSLGPLGVVIVRLAFKNLAPYFRDVGRLEPTLALPAKG